MVSRHRRGETTKEFKKKAETKRKKKFKIIYKVFVHYIKNSNEYNSIKGKFSIKHEASNKFLNYRIYL